MFTIARSTSLNLFPIIVVSISAFASGLACAQNNPFDGSSNSAVTRAPERASTVEEPAITSDTPPTARLLIRSIKQSNPQSPTELAKAIRVMLNVRQFDFAKYYLSRLAAATIDAEQEAQLVNNLGSDFFLTLHATDELAPEGKEFARKMLAASRQFLRSPDQIQSLIGKLNDSDIAVRSRAFRSLRQIGPEAMAALIEVFADEDRQDIFPGVRGALRNIGDQAIPLLRGAAASGDVSVRVESLQALAHYRGESVADVLAAAALDATENQQVRNLVSKAMANQGYRLPAASDLVSRLKIRADALLMGKDSVHGTLAPTVVVWEWNEESNRLQPGRVTISTASRIEAARLAEEAYAVEPHSLELRRLHLLTQLEIGKRAVGTEGELSTVKSKSFFNKLRSSIGIVNPDELNEILKVAVEKKAIPAATACCELLAATGGTQIFHSAGSQLPPVVRAMMLGDRHLQFAALNVIDRLDPGTAYPGSSIAVKLAVFLANSHQRSVGLVGHHRLEVAQSIAGALAGAELFGNSAATSRDLFDAATRDPDVSLLLISDTLVAPRYDELVKQLRADFRTARTPIGLMVRDSQGNRSVARMIAQDPLTFAFPDVIDGEALVSNVLRANDLIDADLSRVTDGDRYRHSIAAAQWLRKISSDRKRFGFYELGPFQEQLTGLLYLQGREDIVSQILANLGTPLAQRELVNFASQRSIPVDKRRVAANSLNRSIETGSTLLTRDEIKQAYDRYNASEQDSKDDQQVLGSILDAIESRRDQSQ